MILKKSHTNILLHTCSLLCLVLICRLHCNCWTKHVNVHFNQNCQMLWPCSAENIIRTTQAVLEHPVPYPELLGKRGSRDYAILKIKQGWLCIRHALSPLFYSLAPSLLMFWWRVFICNFQDYEYKPLSKYVLPLSSFVTVLFYVMISWWMEIVYSWSPHYIISVPLKIEFKNIYCYPGNMVKMVSKIMFLMYKVSTTPSPLMPKTLHFMEPSSLPSTPQPSSPKPGN